MSNDMLGDRRKAMEEAFFARENKALRKRLKEEDDTRRRKEALAAASGITHDAVLEKLAALDIQAEVLHRAQGVAAAAGGFLGIGKKVSAPEQRVLEELATVFSD